MHFVTQTRLERLRRIQKTHPSDRGRVGGASSGNRRASSPTDPTSPGSYATLRKRNAWDSRDVVACPREFANFESRVKRFFFFLDPFDRRSWIIKGKLNIECVVGSRVFFFFFGDRFEGSREWDIIDFEISNLGWIMVRKLHCYEWNILAIFDSWFIWFIDLDFKGNIIMNISNCILTSKVFSYFIIKNYY